VTLAPATSYAHLVPILQSLHQAKLPSYPQIGKLVGCVMGNMQQVSLMHATTSDEPQSYGPPCKPVSPFHSILIDMIQAMQAPRGPAAMRSALAALLCFVDIASLPASPHVDTLCGAINRANLDLEADLVPLLTELPSSTQSLCVHSPAFVLLVRETITKLEARERMGRNPLIVPFKVCAPSCDICRQLHVFCANSTATRTEIFRAGGKSKNRQHLLSMLQPYSQHIYYTTHTSR
jgi:hypothetical protein